VPHIKNIDSFRYTELDASERRANRETAILEAIQFAVRASDQPVQPDQRVRDFIDEKTLADILRDNADVADTGDDHGKR